MKLAAFYFWFRSIECPIGVYMILFLLPFVMLSYGMDWLEWIRRGVDYLWINRQTALIRSIYMFFIYGWHLRMALLWLVSDGIHVIIIFAAFSALSRLFCLCSFLGFDWSGLGRIGLDCTWAGWAGLALTSGWVCSFDMWVEVSLSGLVDGWRTESTRYDLRLVYLTTWHMWPWNEWFDMIWSNDMIRYETSNVYLFFGWMDDGSTLVTVSRLGV